MSKHIFCPDCRTEKIYFTEYRHIDPKGDGVGYEIKVYECPKCGGEFLEDEV